MFVLLSRGVQAGAAPAVGDRQPSDASSYAVQYSGIIFICTLIIIFILTVIIICIFILIITAIVTGF